MSIVVQTIQFKLSGKPYEISLWVDDQEIGSLEAAFHNWQIRTDEHNDYHFAQYITSKGHFALTLKKTITRNNSDHSLINWKTA